MTNTTNQIGDTGIFYPHSAFNKRGKGIKASVIHVWGDQCVNLETEKGHTPTSVLVWRGGLDAPGAPAGYFFVPDPKPAAVSAIETEIQAKGLTAPRVTPQDVEAHIASEHYFTAGAAAGLPPVDGVDFIPPRSVSPLDLLTFCVLVLHNGFTVTGESACASPENFDAEIGKKIARANAVQKIWPLLGHELRTKLALIPGGLANASRPGMAVAVGTKAIRSQPMTRQAYNDLRGWALPVDENGDDDGFLVEYLDGGLANHPSFEGYISWSPAEVYHRAYKELAA